MSFITGLILGVILTLCVTVDKINKLNSTIAHLQLKLKQANRIRCELS